VTPTFAALRGEYARLWNSMAIRPGETAALDAVCRRMLAHQPRYAAVAERTGVPWPFIAIVHVRESNLSFRGHLHNGDPLTARTRQVPAGRPKAGAPPFTWEESAVDALRYHALDRVPDWTVERLAFEFERYNGFGYRRRGLSSPYLWAGSNHYHRGKYVADGVFSATAVDKQPGCLPLLQRLSLMDEGVARLLGGAAAPPPLPDVPSPPLAPAPEQPSWLSRVLTTIFRRT
jgi:lysozyme family protein